MPIATKKTFKCNKCNYEETSIIGDCLPALKPCPKCDGFMQMKSSEKESGLKRLKKW